MFSGDKTEKTGYIGAALVLIVCLCCMTGCCRSASERKPFVASVNGAKIYLDDFKERWQQETAIIKDLSALKPADLDHLKEGVLNRMIEEKILLQRAKELSLTVSDEEIRKEIEGIKKDYTDSIFRNTMALENVDYDQWRARLGRQLLLEKLVRREVYDKISVADEEARKAYDAYRRQYALEKSVHLAQIVVRDRNKAETALQRLKKGDDFGKVARALSVGPEASRGGDLGFISPGVMPDSVDKVVFSLPAGKISPVVISLYGYHVFKVLEREKGEAKRFSELRGAIISDLKKQKGEVLYKQWVEGLRLRAVIKVNKVIKY
jgi:peptidyl-prolyl cis-trans isomerase SurA